MSEEPESDRDLEAELRQGAGREWMEEAAEDERLTELLRRRRMDLGDLATELLHRGERATARIGRATFGGLVVAAGDDYVTLEDVDQTADIRLEAAVWSSIPGDSTATRRQRAESATWKARLAEHAQHANQVRLVTEDGQMTIGVVRVVAVDHIEVEDVDGRAVQIPMRMIQAVIRSTGRH